MTDRNKKHTTPKPWAGARLMKQNAKWHTRRHWTRKRWHRYAAERAAARQHKKRPRLKSTRLRLQAEQALYQKRRARMIALNAKRRAKKRAELEDFATLIVRGVLDNLDAAHKLMRERDLIEIAPGHWRYAVTQPRPSRAIHACGAA